MEDLFSVFIAQMDYLWEVNMDQLLNLLQDNEVIGAIAVLLMAVVPAVYPPAGRVVVKFLPFLKHVPNIVTKIKELRASKTNKNDETNEAAEKDETSNSNH